MTIALTIIAIIVWFILMPTVAVIMAYELTPMGKTPAWLEKSYNTIAKALDRLFTL